MAEGRPQELNAAGSFALDDPQERAATGRASWWALVAGGAQLGAVFAGHLAYPYVHDALIAVAYGLMLPPIAVLHTRHRAVRHSGAILATIAGTAVVTVGLIGSVNVDLQAAAIFVTGMWWWTNGKLWVETGAMPRGLGMVTALLAIVTLAGALLAAVNVGLSAVVRGFPDLQVWNAARFALGAWLIGLGVVLRGLLARP